MAIQETQLKALLVKGEPEQSFLGKVKNTTGESFVLKKEDDKSPVAYANKTRKYLGSKRSKIVTYINSDEKIFGTTTTAEGL